MGVGRLDVFRQGHRRCDNEERHAAVSSADKNAGSDWQQPLWPTGNHVLNTELDAGSEEVQKHTVKTTVHVAVAVGWRNNAVLGDCEKVSVPHRHLGERRKGHLQSRCDLLARVNEVEFHGARKSRLTTPSSATAEAGAMAARAKAAEQPA